MTFAEKLSLAVLGYCVAFAISSLWAIAAHSSGTGATHEPSPDGLGPTGGYPTIAGGR